MLRHLQHRVRPGVTFGRVRRGSGRVNDAEALKVRCGVWPHDAVAREATLLISKSRYRLWRFLSQCGRIIPKLRRGLPDTRIPKGHAVLLVGVGRIQRPNLR